MPITEICIASYNDVHAARGIHISIDYRSKKLQKNLNGMETHKYANGGKPPLETKTMHDERKTTPTKTDQEINQ